MQVLFVLLLLSCAVLLGDDTIVLKNQQPNWRIQVIEEYVNGMPARVELWAPKLRSQDWEKVKEKIYRPDGTLMEERDLTDGVRDGVAIVYYPDSKIRTFTCYSQGTREGVARAFDEQGQLRDQFYYRNDILEGPYELFDCKGKLFEKGNYSKGQKEGEVRFFAETGGLIRKENYSEGLLHGEVFEYYSNGNRSGAWQFYKGLLHGNLLHIASVKYSSERKILEEQDFRMGQPWGIHRVYDIQGRLIKESFIDTLPTYSYEPVVVVTGESPEPVHALKLTQPVTRKKKDGKHETFYENGNKRSLLEYKDGVLNGKKMQWDPEGVLVEEAQYIEGNLEGRYYYREPNGAEKIAWYRNNQLHGLFELIHPEHEFFGKMKSLECRYDDGLLDGDLVEYNTAGAKISQVPYKQGIRSGKALYFNDKGLLFRSVDFQNDQLHGKYEEFYPNGVTRSLVLYREGDREGAETHYFDHGAVKSVTFFSRGQLHGLKKEWNVAGMVIFEGNFQQGKRDGVFRRYDEDGRCIKESLFKEDVKISEKEVG